MKCLFVDDRPFVANIFQIIIEGHLQSEMINCINSLEAKDTVLSLEDLGLVIIGLPQSGGLQELLNTLSKMKTTVPILFVSDDESLHEAAKYIPYHPLSTRISFAQDVNVIRSCILRLLDINARKIKEMGDYCQLNAHLVLSMPVAPYDIFIKVSDTKYVRIYKTGTTLDSNDAQKYIDKGVQNFYLRSQDFLELTKELTAQYSQQSSIKEMRTEKLSCLSQFAHQSVHQTISKLGLSQEALEMADSTIDMVLEISARDKDIKSMLNSFINGQEYISNHSTVTAFVSIAIAQGMSLGDEKTAVKLSMAAFFHDIVLKDHDMAQLRQVNLEEANYFDSKKLSKYIEHPLDAIKILGQLDGVPPDVEKIIVQHHEMPDGTGFPRKLDFKKIFPLSAIFIVSEDFVDSVLHSGLSALNINSIVESMDSVYFQGNFKAAMDALKKVVCYPLASDKNGKIDKVA